MNKVVLFSMFISIVLFSCNKRKINYPETKNVDSVDVYFGTKVSDPYRWLEDDNSQETAEWVKAENEITNQYFSKIPFREQLKKQFLKIWDYPAESAPFRAKKGNKYFFYKNNGLQNQSVLYYKNGINGNPIELLNPNELSENGTLALSGIYLSEDAKYLGYSLSNAGSDWNELFIKDIDSGKDLADHIKWVKFSGMSWYKDGFYYSRYPEPQKENELSGENTNNKVYYHKIGTAQENDILIYENINEPEISYYTEISNSKKYLIFNASKSTSGNALFIKEINGNDEIQIAKNFDKDYSVVFDEENYLYVYTNYNAPKYKIVKIDINNPLPDKWIDIIPEREEVLKSAFFVSNKILTTYLKDARSEAKIFDSNGNFLYNIDNNDIGSILGFGGYKNDSVIYYSFASFTNPGTIYEYDVENNKSTIHKKSEFKINPDEFETKQVFYNSKDGSKIPMFIIHKKGIVLDGNNPTILYGYGGFNISLTPSFSISRTLWLEEGGVYVIANIRGGGEYGEEWHKAGTTMQKQNVFDDFIAAAEYLIKENYTNPKRLACNGGSNGGLLVAAVINQRPDLFAVAIPQVGVLDMLRYHKFTIGRYWATDYGTSEDSKEMFEYLYKYSPIHNIKEGIKYPAIMITTGDHDDRVVPAHSFKYAATLQEKYKGKNPILIRIETEAGHGAGKPTMKTIEEISDFYAFVFYNMNITPKIIK